MMMMITETQRSGGVGGKRKMGVREVRRMRGEHVEREGERIMTTTTSVREANVFVYCPKNVLCDSSNEEAVRETSVHIFFIILSSQSLSPCYYHILSLTFVRL